MPTNTTPLVTYVRLQKALDQDVLRALRASALNIDAELKRLQARVGIGAAMRREQLVRSQIVIHSEMARYWAAVGDTVQAAKAAAAAAGAETMLMSSGSLLSSVFSKADIDYMTRSARASAEQGLRALEERISGSSYVPLAQSVYENNALSSGHIDQIVNNALVRGASAAELARDVRDFVNPNTPGGVRYASLRLGRTELNNSFHAASIRQAQKQPWTTGVQWELSGSHPTPDECNEYAEETHIPGGDPGVFRPEDVPTKPHPNCLCYITNVDVNREEFIRQFQEGKYDQWLEEEMGLPPVSMDTSHARTLENFRTGAKTQHDWYKSDPRIQALDKSDFNHEANRAFSQLIGRRPGGIPEGEDLAKAGYTAYIGSPAADVQAFLRGQPLREFTEDQITDISRAVDEYFKSMSIPLESDSIFYRGVGETASWSPNNLEVGDLIPERGWSSVTIDRSVAEGYAKGNASRGGDWVYEIRFPEGTHLAPGDTDIGELVAKRGSVLRVVSKDVRKRVVQMEYVP